MVFFLALSIFFAKGCMLYFLFFILFVFACTLKKKIVKLLVFLLPICVFSLIIFLTKTLSYNQHFQHFVFDKNLFYETFIFCLKIVSSAAFSFVLILSADTITISLSTCSIIKFIAPLRLFSIDIIISLAIMQINFFICQYKKSLQALRARTFSNKISFVTIKNIFSHLLFFSILRADNLSKALNSRNFTGNFYSPFYHPCINLFIILCSIAIFIFSLTY